jgi:glycine/D-amino acid oxidase-like deaminating enzyme/nitrite reductase/ring-hydroxylating ferredoxin subunit
LEIERLHGQEGAKLAAESHSAAIDRIESIIGEEQIACDFVRLDGYLFLTPGESADLLDRELSAARRAGVKGIERLPRVPLLHFDTGPCLRFPRQAQFHPILYLNAVARAIERAGGRIFTGTHAKSIKGGKPARIETTNGHIVTADAIVVATNSPVNDLVAMHTKQAAYMTYVIGAIVPHGTVSTALYWDTLDPYHYVRIHPMSAEADITAKNDADWHDVLIVGGEDHKTGQPPPHSDPYARLEAWARERFPMIQNVEFRWSGQVIQTIDGLAFIGRNPLDHPNVFIVTGDCGMGITHGAIAGILLTDLILGRENPWAALYDPSRKTLLALDRFVKENFNLVKQYGDWLTGGDVEFSEQIKPGTGAIIRHGMTKMAVYRDELGSIHECSAICTHLGGIVHWNDAEKTWDCPCHGSRFDCHGRVIDGPANRDLNGSESECEKRACDSTPVLCGKTEYPE